MPEQRHAEATAPGTASLTDANLLAHLQECIRSSEEYRDRFRPTWEEVEGQIRCEAPSAWAAKEDWQTKIFIPLQAKKEETATSYLKRMVFGKGRFFQIVGMEPSDETDAQHLEDLVDALLHVGKFEAENDFVITEAVGSPGSSFLKVLLRPDGYLGFFWRTPYRTTIDSACGHHLARGRFMVDWYQKDLSYVIQEARPGGLYADSQAEVDRFLQVAADEAQSLISRAKETKTPVTVEPMVVVRSIDNTTDLTVPSRYRTVDIHELSVEVPGKDGTVEYRFCTVLNQQYLVRNVAHPYGCHPYVGCRTKPRKYDWYGRGYLENGRGFQDLSNSMVNLGFDSAKISSMDIILVDDNKVKDSTSIKYKPLAVWHMKDINGAKIQRSTPSAITDVIRGLQLIDQLDQDASGITRGVMGTPALSGGAAGAGGTQSNTLGEYERQLQLVDQRFLDQARFIENDYVVPLVRLILKIVFNPKLFDQRRVDALIGVKTVDQVESDPVSGELRVVGTTTVPKLDLKKLQSRGSAWLDVRAVGVTQFTNRQEQVQKLKEGLEAALSNPTLTALTKVDVLYEKLWQLSEIDDYEDFLRTKEEVRKLLDQSMDAASSVAVGAPPMAAAPNAGGADGGGY